MALSLARSITLTESDTWLETHSSSPSGRRANPTGSTPTEIRLTILRVLRSMTSTVSAGVFTTNTWPSLMTSGLECGLRKEGCPTFAGTAGAPMARQLTSRKAHAGTRILIMGKRNSRQLTSGSNQFCKHPSKALARSAELSAGIQGEFFSPLNSVPERGLTGEWGRCQYARPSGPFQGASEVPHSHVSGPPRHALDLPRLHSASSSREDAASEPPSHV